MENLPLQTRTIKTVVIEDEKLAARKLVRDLQAFSDLEVVAVLHSVRQGIEYFSSHSMPDLILSDIVLGDGVSFEIFEQCDVQSFIIFTTAFDSYTLRAFKLNAVDYLLKPVVDEELKKAIDKFRMYRFSETAQVRINYKDLLKPSQQYLSRLTVKTGHHLIVLAIQNVLGFYSENKITYAVTPERDYATEYTMEELETLLNPSCYFRISRQVLIEINAIKRVHTSPCVAVELTGKDGRLWNVSRERVKPFKQWLKAN